MSNSFSAVSDRLEDCTDLVSDFRTLKKKNQLLHWVHMLLSSWHLPIVELCKVNLKKLMVCPASPFLSVGGHSDLPHSVNLDLVENLKTI